MKEYNVILKIKGNGSSYLWCGFANDKYDAIKLAKQFQKEYRNLDVNRILITEVEEM